MKRAISNRLLTHWRAAIFSILPILILLTPAVVAAQNTTPLENPFDLLPKAVEESQISDDPPQTDSQSASQPTNDQPAEQPEQAEKPVEQAEQTEKPVEQAEKPRDGVLTSTFKHAYVIDLNGPIFGQFHSYLMSRLERAKRQGADLIILRLTSPGGDLNTSVELARKLQAIDWATTIVFVPEEAISGGAVISLGSDRIYMQPRALIGDAGPIRMTDGVFEHAEEKVVSFLAVAVRELADASDRPGALAEAMVDRNLKVFSAVKKESGKKVYLTEEQTEDPLIQQSHDIGAAVPESGDNRFLTVAGKRAAELGLAEGIFDNEAAMMKELQIVKVTETKINWVDRVVFILNRPLVTGLLLIIGLIAVYIEMSAPGVTLPGMVAAGCFGIFFWSHFFGGTSGWLEILLFVLGILFLMLELFVLPGFGVCGIGGILLVVASLVMATQDFVLPNNQMQWELLQTNSLIVLGAIAGVGLLLFIQLMFLDSLPGLARFQLNTQSGEVAGSLAGDTNATATHSLPEVGESGVTESVLRPSGKVLFDSRLVDVVSEGEYIDPGIQVEVLRREGNRIIVRQVH